MRTLAERPLGLQNPGRLPAWRATDVGILTLPPHPWQHDSWQTPHHVVSRLARYFPVAWVDPVHERDAASRRRREGPPAVWAAPDAPGVTVYTAEWWLPKLFRPGALARWTAQERLRRAQRILAAQGCRRTVVYLWRPEFAPALDLVPHALSCYHIDDDYAFSDTPQPPDPVEVALIRRAGQVFIHSPALMEKKGGLNPRTALAPNGVDYEAYARTVPEPADLARIPRPRIGYTGKLKKQLDWALLLELATRHPAWSFVFVGPRSPHPEIADVLARLARMPNVHFLGGKPVVELFAYPQHFDACIMPYRDTEYTKYIFPLKLHEYLAGGRPTVGTRIRSLEAFAHVVGLCSSPAEWEAALQAALSPAASLPDRRAARQAAARAYDWNDLVARQAATLADRLGIPVPG
jgi:glycosyltransferase involved in cell wall biosynthesis